MGAQARGCHGYGGTEVAARVREQAVRLLWLVQKAGVAGEHAGRMAVRALATATTTHDVRLPLRHRARCMRVDAEVDTRVLPLQ